MNYLLCYESYRSDMTQIRAGYDVTHSNKAWMWMLFTNANRGLSREDH